MTFAPENTLQPPSASLRRCGAAKAGVASCDATGAKTLSWNKLATDYRGGLTLREIAQIHRTNKCTVHNILQLMKVPMRCRGPRL